MGISLQPAHLKRYKDVAYLFMKYGRGDLVKASEIEVEMEQQTTVPGEAPKAAELANDLEKMGPTFVKLGQMLSTRPDLLPVVYIEALSRLQDKVEPFPFEEAEKIIASELGVRLSKAFDSIDPVPIAAASLGQVHRAVMRDGRIVAVKVQRPGIREKMIDDLDSLAEVAEFMDAHTELGRKYELTRTLVEFRRTLLRELDYREEAQNLKTLGRNLEEFKRILVPQPIDDFTTSRVLTMEFVGGSKLTKLSPLVRTEIDGDQLAEELFKAYLKQILVDGFFHADPHPGNALLTPDSKIALLDLGMVARVSPSLQDGLLKVLLAVSEGRGEDAALAMLTVSEKKEEYNEREFVRNVVEIVARNKEASLNNMAVGKVVMQCSKIAADGGVRLPSELITLGKTLMSLDQLGKALDPEFSPNESIRRNATSMMQRKLTGDLTPGNVFSGMLEAKEFAQRLPGRVNKLLDALVNNEMKIEVDAIDETKLMQGFQKVANRITVGLLLGAMIVGAALLARVEGPATVWGYPALATALFLMAAIGAVILLVQILWHDEKQ